MTPLVPDPLTAEAFAPFGRVIEADQAASYPINDGTTRRFHKLATADEGANGEAILSIFVPMERHPWLVVVAERPAPDACRVFLARGDQGVQYAAGTWHHPLLALQPTQDFLVVDREGPGDNCEERWFPEGQEIQIALV
jgi:ureidoglycolate lyase